MHLPSEDLEFLENYTVLDADFQQMLLEDILRSGNQLKSEAWSFFFKKGCHCYVISLMATGTHAA